MHHRTYPGDLQNGVSRPARGPREIVRNLCDGNFHCPPRIVLTMQVLLPLNVCNPSRGLFLSIRKHLTFPNYPWVPRALALLLLCEGSSGQTNPFPASGALLLGPRWPRVRHPGQLLLADFTSSRFAHTLKHSHTRNKICLTYIVPNEVCKHARYPVNRGRKTWALSLWCRLQTATQTCQRRTPQTVHRHTPTEAQKHERCCVPSPA